MGQIGECGHGGSTDPKTCIKAGPAHGQNVLLGGQTLGDVFVVGRCRHCAHGSESELGGGDDGHTRQWGVGAESGVRDSLCQGAPQEGIYC